MPTPIDLLLDPISLGVFGLYAAMMLWEWLLPAKPMPQIRGWRARAFVAFGVYFFLSSYVPYLWDPFLARYQIFDLTSLGTIPGALVGLLVFNALLYAWHRSLHASSLLWRMFHQMHHSAERIETAGVFYFSPLDMVGFTFLGSLALTLVVGLSPQAVTLFLFVGMFLAIFQHANVRTPQWLGYFVQRPESHALHHQRGVHQYNYSDLPLYDMLFGTFRNPPTNHVTTGFFDGASGRVVDMLLMKDISTSRQPETSAKEVRS